MGWRVNQSEAEVMEKIRLSIASECDAMEIFLLEREILSAGEYLVRIVVRTTLSKTSESLTKKLMALFLQGEEIVFKRSYTATLAERGIRVEDFVCEAIISIEGK